ncbi:hypothetical protein PE143B_0117720 [Pseudomonas extremaustralis 14-3 substr. 14-3b]|nr:hypothetical protein PE143B_0117720 [Pseudomonas extremaustralis 14-3 substr. 14-3b]
MKARILLHQLISNNRFYLSAPNYDPPPIARQSISTSNSNKTVYISIVQITCTIYKPYASSIKPFDRVRIKKPQQNLAIAILFSVFRLLILRVILSKNSI